MRIDYREPKKSYASPQTVQKRTKNEAPGSSGSTVAVIIVTAMISLGVGFGSGWTLSQRAAKKGFKAAMEQKSLENSPRQTAAPTPQAVATTNPGAAGTETLPDPQLSFYKNLPNGQKNNALGSGINVKDEKPGRQPLQAAIPTNLTTQNQQRDTGENIKPPASNAIPKTGISKDANTYTVQLSSHSLKSEAESLKNKLAGKGYSAYIAESNLGSKGTWYRVRVGKGLEQDAAKELAGKLGKGAIAIPDKE